MRKFDTGATRDGEDGKYDYEGFLSPIVLQEFARYMHANRIVGDSLRDSDNWQQGIPKDAYAKSLVRHMMDFWMQHRGALVFRPESQAPDATPMPENLIDTLCAILFNVQGYLYELLTEAPSQTVSEGFDKYTAKEALRNAWATFQAGAGRNVDPNAYRKEGEPYSE